jgi:surface polysaccharide O-acyltransferase-like enzyme
MKSIGWLQWARALAAFMVVILHTTAMAVEGVELGSTNWWIADSLNGLCRCCVPLFVMISGSLLLSPKVAEISLSEFYNKRIHRLLYPLAFWTLFVTGLLLVVGQKDIWTYLGNIVLGVPFYHLWYIYMLPMLYLFTPFIARLLKTLDPNQTKFFIVLLMLVTLSLGFRFRPMVFLVTFIPFVSYFVMGYFARFYLSEEKSFWPPLFGYFVMSAIVVVALFFEKGSQSFVEAMPVHNYAYSYCGILVLLQSIFAFLFLSRAFKKSNKFVDFFAKTSLGIYLIHPIMIAVIQELFIPFKEIDAIWYPLIAVGLFLISAFATFVMQKLPLLRHVV